MKRLGIAMLAGMLTVPHAVMAQTAPPEVTPSPAPAAAPDGAVRATLANGMRVVLLPDKLAPVATTLMSYGVGSDDDTQPGIAHATEHMLFRGTPSLSGGQFADVAARMGAQYNAFTTDQFTLYYYKLPSAYADLALRIEADRMVNASIRAADWATERGAIEQEIRAKNSQPTAKIAAKLREVFFAGTPFATASGGTIASFDAMTADQIRAFYRAWYMPSNATLIVSGDIDPDRTLAEIHRRFDAIAGGSVPQRAPVTVPALGSTSLEASIDFPVGFGVLAYRLPGSTDPDYAASRVLAAVFESERAAFSDLTAEGKALGVLSISNAYPEVGASFLLAIPAAGQTPQSMQSLVGGVIDAYRTDGIPADLITAAKTRLLSEQAYAQSSISGLGFAWADAAVQHHTTPQARYDAIATVTPDDVNRVLRAYFTPEHRIAIVITAKPSSATQKVDPGAALEHVGFTPAVHEPLPAWAQVALEVPLRAPSGDRAAMHRLRNGLHYSVRRERAAPTVVVSGFVRTSPELYVPAGRDGLSLVVDGLLPWGSGTYDRKGYQAQLDAIAASEQLGTSFSLKVQAKDFERGMQLLADGLLRPAFPKPGFDVVKAAVLQSVTLANGLPKTKADLAERLALYPPGDPRRRDVTARTVAAIRLEDAKRYYRFAFRPDVTALAVVGDVDPQRVDTAMKASFGAWTATGPRPSFRYPVLAQRATKAQTVTVRSRSTAQSEVTLKQVFRMKRDDRDYVPLLLANTILSGEGTGSLLFEELRTRRGLVYSADSDVQVDSRGAEFSISFASDPKNVGRANAAVVAMVKHLQTHPLSVVELQRAKALLLAQRVLPLDSYSGVADSMLSGARMGYFGTVSERWFWTSLLDTTPAQLQRALRRIDADHFLRVVVQPDA